MLDSASHPTIKGHFIDGDWHPAARGFDDLNPSDGSLFARAPEGGRAEARAAIDAAARA
ncbi:MAG TPA: aldehyde dehydrogenase, partial [Rhodobacteraceae bacterium]|nr:aldehyde dehydrogenase [Paracoccaceae bacterium]